MTSATPQPQAGIDSNVPLLFDPDLTETGVEVGWNDSPMAVSPAVELQVGPPGGPYASIASIPRKYVTSHPLLVAGSRSLGKLIIGTEDRALVPGHVSATKSGNDLYEYSEGQLRQINVLSGTPGAPIGACGAGMAKGIEGLSIRPETLGDKPTSSAHSVSTDGSRVFFYAVPGSQCPTQHELEDELVNGGPHAPLYVRVNGVETLDLGEYKFLAANPQGSSLLLEHVNGDDQEAFLYDTLTRTAEHLFTVPGSSSFEVKISADFSTIYISTTAQLTPEAQAGTGTESQYRYDVSSKTLHYLPLHFEEVVNVSANVRYLVFQGSSEGFPGVPGGVPREEENGLIKTGAEQIYRYDSSENVIECVDAPRRSIRDRSSTPPPFMRSTVGMALRISGSRLKTATSSSLTRRMFWSRRTPMVKSPRPANQAPNLLKSSGRGRTMCMSGAAPVSMAARPWRDA